MNFGANRWVLLSYRVPREPSTPRIAIWRKLNQLGVAKIVDGLVALPDSDTTRDRLEWVAVSARQAGGSAAVWVAEFTDITESESLRAQMNEERNEEFADLRAEVESSSGVDARTINRWRRTWRAIQQRDYFGAEDGELARIAIADVVTNGRILNVKSEVEQQESRR